MIVPPTKIYLDNSPIHGLGVFSSAKIEEGEIFEVCPYLDLEFEKGSNSSILIDYRFNWPQGTSDWEKQVVGLGYSSFYNHSESPNAAWRSNMEKNVFEFYALKEISPGQEIFVWYGGVDYWADGRQNTKVI